MSRKLETAKRIASRTLARKRQILEAASRIFRQKGLHATSMRDIAADLGMQVGNLYHYFENRQELLAFCQQETLTGLLRLASWIESLDLPHHAKLYLMVQGHVQHLNEDSPGSLAHLEVEALSDPWRKRIQAQRDIYESTLRRLIADGITAGELRSADPKTAALAILGSVNWTVKWFRPGGTQSVQDIGAAFAEHMVRGLLAPGVDLEIPTLRLPRPPSAAPSEFS